jgi:hypothetical protein
MPTRKSTPLKAPNKPTQTQYEGIKMLGILHFIGNILSGGTL